MAKRSMYGEDTVLVSIRVPESKKDEIMNRFYRLLDEYLVIRIPVIKGVIKVDNDTVVKKKSDPLDNKIDMDSLKAIANGIKPFKCGCWIDEKNQLRRSKGSSCNLYKSEHK